MLTDSPRVKQIRTRKKRPLGGKIEYWYSDSQKTEAVKLWLVTGNLKIVSATLDIPYDTLKTWRYSNWWGELTTEIRTEGSFQLSNRLKTIAERALTEIEDRLENGDWVLNQKTGQMQRKKVGAQVAVNVASTLLDKQKVLEQRPIDELNNQKIQDRLVALADAFAHFAGGTFNAISKERSEGLQAGTSVGASEETPQIEGPRGEDSSPEDDGEGIGELAYEPAN